MKTKEKINEIKDNTKKKVDAGIEYGKSHKKQILIGAGVGVGLIGVVGTLCWMKKHGILIDTYGKGGHFHQILGEFMKDHPGEPFEIITAEDNLTIMEPSKLTTKIDEEIFTNIAGVMEQYLVDNSVTGEKVLDYSWDVADDMVKTLKVCMNSVTKS